MNRSGGRNPFGLRAYCIGALWMAVCCVTVSSASGQEAVRVESTGLNDIVRGDVPSDISDAISGMKRAVAERAVAAPWNELLDGMEKDLHELFGGSASLERQRELVDRLVHAGARLRRTVALPEAAPIAPDLGRLAGRLERRAAILSAAVKLLTSSDAPEGTRTIVGDLWRDLAEWERSATRDSAARIMAAYQRLAKQPGAAAELADVVNTHYNHYNVRAVVSGRLLDAVARAERSESGSVSDVILNSDVVGQQTTKARIGVKLMPNSEAASYLLQVDGRTETDTQSYPRQEGGEVSIQSRSVSRFIAQRRVDLTADGMRAGEPVISVKTSNRVVDAETPASGVPLFGSIGRSMAMGEASARRSEVESIGEARVRERVLPEFGSESDDRIRELNERYQTQIKQRLEKSNAFPDVLNFSSTESHMFVLGRTARAGELGGHEPLLWVPRDSQVTIQVHESALNNAFERGNLSREKIDEHTIGRLTARAAEGMGQEPETAPELEPEESIISIKLAERDGLRVRFQQGVVQLEFRAATVQKDEDQLANQLITVRYALEPQERTLKVVRRGDIELRPLEAQPQGEPKADTAIFRDALELIFLPQFEISAIPPLKNRQEEPIPLSVVNLIIADGWLSLSLR